MKLARKIDRAMVLLMATASLLVVGLFLNMSSRTTFADNDGEAEIKNEYFVNIYDEGQKLTVKTTASTVAEVLSRASVELNNGDIVEPGLNETIDADNFFINIHRARPVIVKDGVKEKCIMIASYDPYTIAKEAGISLQEGDEVVATKNTNFLETGMTEIYEVKRAEQKIEIEEIEVGEIAQEMAKLKLTLNVSRLTARMGRNRYVIQKPDGVIVERQETYYDLPMSGVMAIAARECGAENYYTVREDGVKVDAEGYVLVAANLDYYPRCTVVETSLGLGRVYDTGSFALSNPEQFDLATDWTNHNGR